MSSLLFVYSLILSLLLTGGALLSTPVGSKLPLLLFFPVTLSLIFILVGRIKRQNTQHSPFRQLLSHLFLYYGFIIVAIMTIFGILGAKTVAQFFSVVVFLPLSLYFILQILPKKVSSRSTLPIFIKKKDFKKIVSIKNQTMPDKTESLDIDRRKFLKFIGSAGISLFFLSLVTKKAQAAFFGSVPGPGTVSLKDTSGSQIDPAIKHPTDGYTLAQLDDSSPSYFGYLDKNGNWYILKEDINGNYRYAKGSADFPINWTNRSDLNYGYFNAVFSN